MRKGMSSAGRCEGSVMGRRMTRDRREDLDPGRLDSCRRRADGSGDGGPDLERCICLETGKETRVFGEIPILPICVGAGVSSGEISDRLPLRPDLSPAATYILLLSILVPLSQSPPSRPPSAPDQHHRRPRRRLSLPLPVALAPPSPAMSMRTPRQAERDIRLHDPHHSHSLPPPSHPPPHPPHLNGNGHATPNALAGPSRGAPIASQVLSPSTQPVAANGEDKTNPLHILNQANEQTWLMIGAWLSGAGRVPIRLKSRITRSSSRANGQPGARVIRI